MVSTTDCGSDDPGSSLTSITFLFLFLKYDTHVSNKFFVLIVKTFLICLEINNVKLHRKKKTDQNGQVKTNQLLNLIKFYRSR